LVPRFWNVKLIVAPEPSGHESLPEGPTSVHVYVHGPAAQLEPADENDTA
jgi:hypothetical protein